MQEPPKQQIGEIKKQKNQQTEIELFLLSIFVFVVHVERNAIFILLYVKACNMYDLCLFFSDLCSVARTFVGVFNKLS